MTLDLVVPVRRFKPTGGRFRWPAGAVLASPSFADLLPLGQLAQDLREAGIVRPVIRRNAFGQAAVRIRRDSRIDGPEAYRIAVAPEAINVSASSDAGAYYAIQTLRELVKMSGNARPAVGRAQPDTSIPTGAIDDSPDFTRRGLYFDCSRGRVPKLETLKALVLRLAHWKVNELQLYIENVFTFARHQAIGKGYSPFTPQDLLELQDFCRQHHVKFVGSLASFGHTEKILQLPAYRHLGEMPGHLGWPGGTTLCPVDPGSIKLVAELYEEFVPLFEAGDFNVCGDEPWELGKGRSAPAAKRVGAGRVYLDFMTKVYRLASGYGKRVNAWADIVLEHPELLGDWPRDIVMLNWDYVPGAKRMVQTRQIRDAGLEAVVCPGTNSWLSHGCRLEMGMRNIEEAARIGLADGAQGLLNTDWGDFGHRNMLAVSLHNFAYGAAHGWNHRQTQAQGFTQRFCRNVFCRVASRVGKYSCPPDSEALAQSIRTLGAGDEFFKQGHQGSRLLYISFLKPLASFIPAENGRGKTLDAVKAEDISAFADVLKFLAWPAQAAGADPFLKNVIAEFELATRQDLAACSRLLAIKQLRLGKKADTKPMIGQVRQLARQFERTWLMGNRPSRLADNLLRFDLAAREYAGKKVPTACFKGFSG
jgi:hypothetical protein